MLVISKAESKRKGRTKWRTSAALQPDARKSWIARSQQLTETKLMQQRAVLSAMQSQIHSHFLYNTLESINSMAHLAGQCGY